MTTATKNSKLEFATLLESKRFPINAGQLKRALELCVPCCDLDSTRYALGGVHIVYNSESESIVFESTDSRRLVRHELRAFQAANGIDSFDVVIDACDLKKLERGIKKSDESAIVLVDVKAGRYPTGGGKTVYEFHFWGTHKREAVYQRFECDQLEGRFPETERVIPEKRVNWTLSAKSVNEHFANQFGHRATLLFDGDALTISPMTRIKIDPGKYADKRWNVEKDLNQFETHFDLNFLHDITRFLHDDALIEVSFTDPGCAARFDTYDATYVVMPLSN